MIAFRRLLAQRAPVLRFSSSYSDFSDLKALTIEDQIEGIDKSLENFYDRINTYEDTILEKSKAIQKVFHETNKAFLEYVSQESGHPSETPDVNTILKALEKLGDALKVLSIDDCESETPDVTKILQGVEEWVRLKDGFDEYHSPMLNVEEDLKLVTSVRIIKARVNDARKRLQNDKE